MCLCERIASALAGDDEVYDVIKNIRAFNKIVYQKDGDIHRPRMVEIIWGQMVFSGALTSLSYNFKQPSNPDGTPLRATAQVSFRQTLDGFCRKQNQNLLSDLTHLVTVKGGIPFPC
ncbi:MAG: hypothetical protein R3B47_08840 [Bacteroidia bacterium]